MLALPMSWTPSGMTISAYSTATNRRRYPAAPTRGGRGRAASAAAYEKEVAEAMKMIIAIAPLIGTAMSKSPAQVMGCSAVVSAAKPVTARPRAPGSASEATADAAAFGSGIIKSILGIV